MSFDSVLLIGFGGPTRPEEIRPFLQNVARGRPIPPERLDEVARHYEEMGGRSPFNELTFRQAGALASRLAERGLPLPVYVGMRNWHPFLRETLQAMAEAGLRRAVGVILAAHRTEASWSRYQQDVAQAREAMYAPLAAPEVEYAGDWHLHPGFIAAQAERIRKAVLPGPDRPVGGPRNTADASGPARGDAGSGWPQDLPLLFTAHSVPVEMASGSRYVEELQESSAAVAGLLGAPEWRLVFQSRSGSPGRPWLEPDVNDAIRRLAGDGARQIALAPIGFLCDHVEVLYDLDVEARRTAARAGVRLFRAGAVGDHPRFIDALADVVGRRTQEGTPTGVASDGR